MAYVFVFLIGPHLDIYYFPAIISHKNPENKSDIGYIRSKNSKFITCYKPITHPAKGIILG